MLCGVDPLGWIGRGALRAASTSMGATGAEGTGGDPAWEGQQRVQGAVHGAGLGMSPCNQVERWERRRRRQMLVLVNRL